MPPVRQSDATGESPTNRASASGSGGGTASGVLARSIDAVALIVASALAACLLHILVSGTMRRLLHLFSWKWWLRDQLFVSSVGYLLVFAVLTVVPSLFYLAWPRGVTFARLLAFHVALATLSVLLVFSRVAPWAMVLVALGAAVQVLRVAQSRERALRPRIRWLAGALFGATALAVGVIHLVGRRAESRALAAIPPAPEGTPNVLLIILDTVRASSMGLLGGPVDNTPHLAELARRGVVFEEAYSTASWTLPSHASIFTGEYASVTGADWARPLGTERQTLAEALAADGLVGGGFVANTVAAWYRTGLGRGFVHFDNTKHSLAEFALSTTLTQSSSVVRAYMGWIRTGWWRGALPERPADLARPAGQLRHARPHRRRARRRRFSGVAGDTGQAPVLRLPQHVRCARAVSPTARLPHAVREERARLRPLPRRHRATWTARSIARCASWIGAGCWTTRSSSSRRTMASRSASTVSSGHGNGLYRNQLRVPLVIANAPGSTAGLRVEKAISLRDLPATILDLAGTRRGTR